MKKEFLLVAMMTIMIPLYSTLSQTLADYISEVKKDTLVVKDYYDMNNEPNSLYYALLLDSVNVPASRVYELKVNGYYPLSNISITSASHPTVIAGSDPEMAVNNKNVNSPPPVICKATMESDSEIDHCIDADGNLTIKNCALVPASNDGSIGRSFTDIKSPGLHVVFDNCIMEHTGGFFVVSEDSNCALTFRNCYFVNMSGYPCRSNGGAFDCFAPQDSLLVENCTHIMAQGSLYKFKAYQFNSIIINHSSFINCAGNVFLDLGYQHRVSLVSNIFINCNLQCCTEIHSVDLGEHDPDWLPIGIVNVFPDKPTDVVGAYNAPSVLDEKTYYVDKNLVYWDPLTDNMSKILNENKVDGISQWLSQMITMNSRSQMMFDNNPAYPFLTEGTWYKNQLPDFADPRDLFTTQLLNIKTFALATIDTSEIGRTAILPAWRLISTGPESFVHPDWPIPIDLSYNNADLMTAGLNAFPVGDLNWFPVHKAAWLTQRDAEYAEIGNRLYVQPIIGIKEINSNIHSEFMLKQNYPNPFNPSTKISFSIAKAGYATLKVYNSLGREIATLVDGFKSSQSYNVKFDGTGLASGIYFYHLRVNGYSITKKMVLIR